MQLDNTKEINLPSVHLIGHVIFEMACGCELTGLVPGQQEYRSVRDKSVRDVLQVIFQRNKKGRFTSSIKQVYYYSPSYITR